MGRAAEEWSAVLMIRTKPWTFAAGCVMLPELRPTDLQKTVVEGMSHADC